MRATSTHVTITPRTYDDGQPITAGITYDWLTSDLTSRIGQDIHNGSFLGAPGTVITAYDDGSGWYEPPFRAGGNVQRPGRCRRAAGRAEPGL